MALDFDRDFFGNRRPGGGSVPSDMSSPVGLTVTSSASVGTLSMAGSLVCANAIIGTDAPIAVAIMAIRIQATRKVLQVRTLL